MRVKGKHYRTIWVKEGNDSTIQIIDQRNLPHQFIIAEITTVNQMAEAIKDMHVRGAGLIGAAAGYGMYLATLEANTTTDFNTQLQQSAKKLMATRPTAVNLSWAVNRQVAAIETAGTAQDKIAIALQTAHSIADEDAEYCRKIGEAGLTLIKEIQSKKIDQQIGR